MNELLQVAQLALLLVVWITGLAAERAGCPALVAEICVGMVLGGLADFVPHTAALKVLGLLGLHLLVLEGGLYIDLQTLRRIGLQAGAIAISGTTLPVLAAIAVLPRFAAFGGTESLVAGTALSSTAIGMAAKLMQSRERGTPTGHLYAALR